MRTLVIDCATESCSVALFDETALVSGDFAMLGRGHAERLVPMIAAMPDKGRADRIAVALGPGSFTGVRIGLATARALELAWNAPALGYPTLALLAAMAQADQGAQPVTCCITGGHGQWFTQDFDAHGKAASALASLDPADAAARTSIPLVAGSQAEALVTRRGHGSSLALWPDARAFSLLDPAYLQPATHPLYGRPPDARLPGSALP